MFAERPTSEVVAMHMAQTRAAYARANVGRKYDSPGTLRTLFRRIAAR